MNQVQAQSLELGLLPHRFPRAGANGCRDPNEPAVPGTYTCDLDGVPGVPEDLDVDFQCLSLVPDEPRSCVVPCDPTAIQTGDETPVVGGCAEGFVCSPISGTAGVAGLCVEAPAIDVACLPDPLEYRVSSGASFLVSRSSIPGRQRQSADPQTGACVLTPDLDWRENTRISLNADVCANAVNVQNLTEPPLAAAGNVSTCAFLASNVDAGGVLVGSEQAVLFQDDLVRFALTGLDSFIGDRATIGFSIFGGERVTTMTPSSRLLSAALPARLVTGPMQVNWSSGAENPFPFPYLYYVDAGRTRADGLRGQVLRLNPRTGAFSSTLSDEPFLIR